MNRSNYCGLINASYIGKPVELVGWVHRRRDLGGLIFLDLRDREGIVQIVVEPDNSCFKNADLVKHEYVIAVSGQARQRPNPNLQISTGQVEVVVDTITILNTAIPTPILVDDATTSEASRMSNRVIDLRSQQMQYNIRLRHKLTRAVRNFLDENGFIDIETPFLTKSTPGGARDFLVPSTSNKGKFYALPQSPQVFKQLLMVAGFDRYYQIVKCFRDEALRADRQPEFTQIDIETSFLNERQIREIAESLIVQVFAQVLDVKLPPFPVMKYADAMFYYGSDKPDLRIPLKFIDLTNCFKACQFKVFNLAANNPDGRIIALKLPSSISLSRKEIDEYTKFVATHGARGLAYIKVNDITQLNDVGLQSPIVKFLSAEELENIITKTEVQNGEILLFGADSAKVVNEAMGALRIKLGHDKQLLNCDWAPLWVVDFPLFEYNAETGKYMACHHPFTAPKDVDIDRLVTNPDDCLAKAYDMVLNGSEIGGGSIRIHDATIQAKVFEALDISEAEAQNKFGFLLSNLQYGAPPHGGVAFGLDRLASLMCGSASIREVIAFPKTISGQCLLTNAPTEVSKAQLDELGVKILPPE